MPVSQNGYSANDRSVIASLTVPGTARKIALRKGDTSVILLDIMAWVHAHVEPIDTGVFDDWGYAERKIRGSSTTLSNHASGTAVDANATQHPLGVRGTWTADERRRINGRLALYEGCVRWGDNYSGRVDGMHFEIDRGAAACRVIADRIRAGKLGGTPNKPAPSTPAPPPEDDLMILDKTFLARGHNDFRLVVPVGTGSAAWGLGTAVVSIVGNGPVTGTVYVQNDKAGIETWPVKVTNTNGICARFYKYLPSGTTQVGVVLDAPNGGTVVIEGKEK